MPSSVSKAACSILAIAYTSLGLAADMQTSLVMCLQQPTFEDRCSCYAAVDKAFGFTFGRGFESCETEPPLVFRLRCSCVEGLLQSMNPVEAKKVQDEMFPPTPPSNPTSEATFRMLPRTISVGLFRGD